MSLSLTNRDDIVANSVSIINSKGQLVDLIQMLGDTFIGLPPDTLDTLEKIATAIDNDPGFLTTVRALLDTKANQTTTYTKVEVNQEINKVINAAPEALNTLKEIATALNDDANFAATMTNLLSLKTSKIYVDEQLLLKSDKTYVDNTFLEKYKMNEIQAQFAGVETSLTRNAANILLKSNKTDVYTKTESDNALLLKADSSTTYSKTEVNAALDFKANAITTYSKTEVNNSLLLKANTNTTYTKDEVDVSINDKQRTLLVSQPSGGASLLSGTRLLKGLTVNEPLTLTDSDANVSLGFNYNKITVAGPLTKSVLEGGVIKLLCNAYSIADVDTALGLKADSSATYSKTEVNAALDFKANASTTYSKTEVNNSLLLKANTNTTYTKDEVDVSINDKQRTLLVSQPSGGASLLSGSRLLKGLTVNEPLTLTDSDDNVSLGFNYNKITVAGPLTKSVLEGGVIKLLCNAYSIADVDTALGLKVDSSATYSKDEVINLLNLRALAILTYTKSQVDSLLTTKAPLNDVYNKQQTQQLINAETYTKIQSDNQFEQVFEVESPLYKDYDILTGTNIIKFDSLSSMEISNLTVNGNLTANNISYNPWWVAGKVDGTTLTIIKNKGRYPFTVSRTIAAPVGTYNIEWTQAHPDGTNYISCCSGEGGGWNDLVNGIGANYTYNDKKMNCTFRKLWQGGTATQSEGPVDCIFSFFIMA